MFFHNGIAWLNDDEQTRQALGWPATPPVHCFFSYHLQTHDDGKQRKRIKYVARTRLEGVISDVHSLWLRPTDLFKWIGSIANTSLQVVCFFLSTATKYISMCGTLFVNIELTHLIYIFEPDPAGLIMHGAF